MVVLYGQQPIPVIKAKSEKADIKCNGKTIFANKEQSWWRLMPEVRPDIFYSEKIGDTISFHTDLDSISIIINENTKFDFIVLRKKDSAFIQIAYQEPYIVTLKKAAQYDELQQREIPKFTYQDCHSEDLKKIRTELNLDSIAGYGNEISQLLNIMHWVHNTIRHDGLSDNPEHKNALDLIRICKNESRGINCWMMAILLNECYLSLGFKSNMLTCMPKQLDFDESHVINIVYSNQLNKWIWLDPTNDAYVMNEKGELLGVAEVREKLINGDSLVLNPDANWNNITLKTKEDYLYNYMAKNLYRLRMPVNSTYNLQTVEENKTIEYIELLPLDGINQDPTIVIQKNEETGVAYKTYITNNPGQFWGE